MAKYGLNRVTLIGNLGQDPEVRYLQTGVAVTSLRVACTEAFRDREGNYQDRTEWISVTLWRKQAEIAGRYLRKGSTVYLEGRIINRSWETETGEKRYKTEVEGTKLILLDPPPSRMNTQAVGQMTATPPSKQPPKTEPQTPQVDTSEQTNNDKFDDLPF